MIYESREEAKLTDTENGLQQEGCMSITVETGKQN